MFQVEYLTGSLAQVKVFGKLHNIPRYLENIFIDALIESFTGNMQPMETMG